MLNTKNELLDKIKSIVSIDSAVFVYKNIDVRQQFVP